MSIEFNVDRTNIRPGECVTFHWRVAGVKAVYFYREGERWQDHGVVGEESRQECPSQSIAYNLRVVKADDSVEIRQIPIQVQSAAAAEAIDFTVDRTNIQPGECVTFHWRVAGVKAVYFYREGERWQEHGVVGEARRQECPSQATTYCLRVVKQDGSKEIRRISIQVQPAAAVPSVERFSVDPSGRIRLGQCVDIHWRVAGNANRVRISRKRKILLDNAPLAGDLQDCPGKPGEFTYHIEAAGPGGTDRAEQTVKVIEQPPASELPPVPPPPDQPVIHTFTVNPQQIKLGGCVTLSWKTGGGTSWVTIVRGEHIVLDPAPLSGSVQDCPDTAGEVGYRIVAFNPEDERVRQDRAIDVMP